MTVISWLHFVVQWAALEACANLGMHVSKEIDQDSRLRKDSITANILGAKCLENNDVALPENHPFPPPPPPPSWTLGLQ